MTHIETRWYDETQKIICYKFMPGWVLDDFYSIYSITEEMIRKSPEQVIGIIVDDRDNSPPPPGALTAFQIMFKRGTLPIAFIGGHYLTQLFLKVTIQTVQSNRLVVQVSNFDEALFVLRQNTENSLD